jgi:predicted nucleic acid-binding protein
LFISSDTNIWIDFQEIGHLDHPFLLGHSYFISQDAFRDELLNPKSMRNDLLHWGIQIANITDQEYNDALIFQARYPSLSLYDAFALAIAKLRGWTLLTGDKPLRKAANKEGVVVYGTIWIYDQLKNLGKISEDDYDSAIADLITAVQNGRCRLPLDELFKRKRP